MAHSLTARCQAMRLNSNRKEAVFVWNGGY